MTVSESTGYLHYAAGPICYSTNGHGRVGSRNVECSLHFYIATTRLNDRQTNLYVT
jgi:hypothetical protein